MFVFLTSTDCLSDTKCFLSRSCFFQFITVWYDSHLPAEQNVRLEDDTTYLCFIIEMKQSPITCSPTDTSVILQF